MKKIFSLLLVLSLMLSFSQSMFADNMYNNYENLNSSNVYDIDVIQSLDSVNMLEQVYVEGLNTDNVLNEVGIEPVVDANLKEGQIHLSDYSGAYIDSNDTLVLLFVEGSETLDNIKKNPLAFSKKRINSKINKSNDDVFVKFKAATFSENELNNVYNFLVDKSIELGISTACIDIPSNRINIGIISSDRKVEKRIIKLVKDNFYSNKKNIADILLFDYITEDDIPKLTTTVNESSTFNKERISLGLVW